MYKAAEIITLFNNILNEERDKKEIEKIVYDRYQKVADKIEDLHDKARKDGHKIVKDTPEFAELQRLEKNKKIFMDKRWELRNKV